MIKVAHTYKPNVVAKSFSEVFYESFQQLIGKEGTQVILHRQKEVGVYIDPMLT